MKPYERLGISEGMLGISAKIGRYQRSLAFVPPRGRGAKANAMFICCGAAEIAISYHLSDDPPPMETKQYAIEAVNHAINRYFFGAWRTEAPEHGLPPLEIPLRSSWIAEYRLSLMWAAVLNDWASARRLSEYPEDDGRDQSNHKSEATWYLLLAEVLKQPTFESNRSPVGAVVDRAAREPLPDSEPPVPNGVWLTPDLQLKPATYEELVEHGSKKRVKLLATVLSEVLRGDAAAANQAFQDYMKYFKKTEYPRAKTPEDKVSIDGTILYHLARRVEIILEIPPQYADHIIRL